jgi:hypothetical protein
MLRPEISHVLLGALDVGNTGDVNCFPEWYDNVGINDLHFHHCDELHVR